LGEVTASDGRAVFLVGAGSPTPQSLKNEHFGQIALHRRPIRVAPQFGQMLSKEIDSTVTPHTPWHKNDELFRKQIKAGRKWEAYVAHKLIVSGLEVFVPRFEVRPHVSQRSDYRDERDMIVEGKEVEVKSTRFGFDRPKDFPFDPCFVDTEEKIVAKGPPFAFLIVSQETGAIMAVPGKTRDRWVEMSGFDHKRGINVKWLGCPIGLVRSFDEFVTFLKVPRLT
jgi:hypothetical protein